MAALKNRQNPISFSPYRFQHPFSSSILSKSFPRIQNLHPALHSNLLLIQFTKKSRVPRSSVGFLVNRRSHPIRCFCHQTQATAENVAVESERPPFDINLAVLLAGFAFEAYNSPPESVGKREVDAANCQTVFLSNLFVREVYDGQLFIKLKKGLELPALDPWGTSDPYVVLQFDGQVVKSKVKWATREPIWNEDFTINIKIPPKKNLQVAAWDANLVTPHKRMGNAAVDLEPFCDGNTHELLVALGGMGAGGGKIRLEVRYKSFDDIDKEKQWWRIPLVSELLAKNAFTSALKKFLGSDSVQASEFVQFAFGQLRSLNSIYQKNQLLDGVNNNVESPGTSLNPDGDLSEQPSSQESISEGLSDSLSNEEDKYLPKFDLSGDISDNDNANLVETEPEVSMGSDAYFWKKLADVVNQSVMQKLGLVVPEKIKWDGFETLKNMSSLARKIADAQYVESGLAAPKVKDVYDDASDDLTSAVNGLQSALPEIKKASLDLLKQTDAVLGALMVLTQQKKEADAMEQSGSKIETSVLDQKNAEEMRELFSTAESAMEAWAMLATSMGRPSFIKSEFEKICFLDNPSTDTQVAIWRDTPRKRLVVAFRGTEQARWKDLRTDLMLVPTGLNPERIGGDSEEEIQVHSGFLSAYDSVKNRLMSLIKVSIGFEDGNSEITTKWQVYVTGHSLGGALATLLALELSSSQMAKHGAISITMYNFGSPRVGNKRFAEVYNKKVKDSWRVVNHRDIIPTVPRLMGYCHVAQPIYLAAGELEDALENMELLADGYEGDVIGEYPPDLLVSEFMKGERELVEKILQTEINIFRAIRDGTALMQHMEDFYYITLLESVRSSYRTVGNSTADKDAPLIT